MSKQAFNEQLKKLVRELWFPSETEAPWTIPTWTIAAMDDEHIRQGLRREADAAVREISLDDLMAQVQRRCKGYGTEGQEIARQHGDLIDFLRQSCDRVRVFRVGEITVDILLIGETPNGYAVLQTQSVET